MSPARERTGRQRAVRSGAKYKPGTWFTEWTGDTGSGDSSGAGSPTRSSQNSIRSSAMSTSPEKCLLTSSAQGS